MTAVDASAVAAILSDTARCGYRDVRLLIGPQATQSAISQAFREVAQTAEPADTVAVYFSGHGKRLVTRGIAQHLLIPYDYDAVRYKETAISGDEFTSLLRDIPARRLLVLLNCCHSGGVHVRGTLSDSDDLINEAIPLSVDGLLTRGEGTIVIASSRADELSWIGKPYSVFTRTLVEAFSGEGAAILDGYVRAADLALHASRRVAELTGDRQHPVLHFEHADNFRVAYYAAGSSTPLGVPGDWEVAPASVADRNPSRSHLHHAPSGSASAADSASKAPELGVAGALRDLRSLLCGFYADRATAALVANDAKVPTEKVRFEFGAAVFWDDILRAAHDRDRMEGVFKVVDEDGYEVNEGWVDAKATYRLVREQESKHQSRRANLKVVPPASPPSSLHGRALEDLQDAVAGASPALFSDPRLAAETALRIMHGVTSIERLIVAIRVATEERVVDNAERFRLRRLADNGSSSLGALSATLEALSITTSARQARPLCEKLAATTERILLELGEATRVLF